MGRRNDAQNLKSQEPSYTSDLILPARTIAPSALWCWRTFLVLLAVLSAVLLSGGNALAQTVATDKAALEALYNAAGGADWADNTNWLSNEPLSSWHGVITASTGEYFAAQHRACAHAALTPRTRGDTADGPRDLDFRLCQR